MAASTANFRILITGECGQVGEALHPDSGAAGQIVAPTLADIRPYRYGGDSQV